MNIWDCLEVLFQSKKLYYLDDGKLETCIEAVIYRQVHFELDFWIQNYYRR